MKSIFPLFLLIFSIEPVVALRVVYWVALDAICGLDKVEKNIIHPDKVDLDRDYRNWYLIGEVSI